MVKPRLLAVLASAASLSFGLAMGPVATSRAGTVPVRYGGVLEVAMPWVTIPDNFDPLNPGTNGSTAGGTAGVLYEPLMYDNIYNGQFTPMLATGYRWSDGAKVLTLYIRQDVKWSDGKAFSAADVAFTFNYLKKHAAVDTGGIWADNPLVSVKAAGTGAVVFRFSKPDSVALPSIIGQLIVPEHIFANISDPATFANTHPVGTGPFLLQSYGPTEVSYTRNPAYWMPGRPYIDGVTMSAVQSGSMAELRLLDGQASMTYDGITNPDATFVPADPRANHYWWPVTNLNFLYLNTTEAPFSDVAFRKAIAEALNDNVIATRAYYGAIPAGNGPVETGVTNGQDAEWVPSWLSELEWSYSPKDAASSLNAAGYKDVRGSLRDRQGHVLPTFKILIGAGWPDYISMAETIGQELAPLGVHTIIDQEPYATYASWEDAATYSMAISWSNNNSATPYYEYEDLLDGNPTTDWERYSSPADSAALSSFAATWSLPTQKADMLTIERDILTNVPVVALTGRTNFLDYSTRYFTGWPSASDPYNAGEPPDAFDGGAEQVYLNVHLT
jgi:peptide/nickel transport system substrate-binding protein